MILKHYFYSISTYLLFHGGSAYQWYESLAPDCLHATGHDPACRSKQPAFLLCLWCTVKIGSNTLIRNIWDILYMFNLQLPKPVSRPGFQLVWGIAGLNTLIFKIKISSVVFQSTSSLKAYALVLGGMRVWSICLQNFYSSLFASYFLNIYTDTQLMCANVCHTWAKTFIRVPAAYKLDATQHHSFNTDILPLDIDKTST